MSETTPEKEAAQNIDYDKLAEALIGRLEDAGMDRRDMLRVLAGAGAGGLGAYLMTGRASADPSDASGTVYFEQIGDDNNRVSAMYVDELNNLEDAAVVDTIEFTAGAGPFEVQKDGTDGNGVLNFKTEE